MRTKTLLIAAAALVAGVVSSEAQVYSANIVGYVNVVVPQSPAFAAVANPLDLDGVDNITNVLANAPKGTTVDLFNAASGFSTVVTRGAINGVWSANAATTFIPPGVGFLIKGTTAFTNTFVGSVLIPTGGTNNLSLPALTLAFVGSPVPYSGTLTNVPDNGPGSLNLGVTLPKNSQIQTYNNGFTVAATKGAITGTWNANPTLSVGQAFFIKSGSATNWVQTLP
jgi:hypothetical protein